MGQKLRQHLKAARIRPEDFGETIGVSRSYIYHILAGTRRVSPPLALRIQAATGGDISAAYMLGVETEEGAAA